MIRLSLSAACILAWFILMLPVAAPGQQTQVISCIQCHEGLQESLARPVELWRKSIHAQNGITCAGCHGGDPTVTDMGAMSPEKEFLGAPKEKKIPDFCGRCHPGVEDDYRESAHGRALGAGGPQCVTCHGSHAVERASLALINRDSCTRCHGFERAEQIRDALSDTDSRISRLDQRLRQLYRVGFDVGDLKGRLFDARNTFHRLFHTVDVETVRSSTGTIQARLEDIGAKAEELEIRLKRRRQAGMALVGLLLLVTLLFSYLRSLYGKEERQPPR